MNKAAEVLFVSQPSLTSAVRELEKELGITLLNRGGKGVTLTNDGAEFLQYARQVVAQYDAEDECYQLLEAVAHAAPEQPLCCLFFQRFHRQFSLRRIYTQTFRLSFVISNPQASCPESSKIFEAKSTSCRPMP